MRYAILIALLVACAPAEAEHEAVIETPDAKEVAPQPSVKRTIISAAAAEAPSPLSVGGPDFYGSRWIWPAYGTYMFYPVTLPVGCLIASVSHRVYKTSDANARFTVEIVAFRDGVEQVAIGATNQDFAPGLITIPVAAVPAIVVSDSHDYQIRVTRLNGPAGVDHSMWSAVDASCP
jgi:hypothetical protein